MRTGTVLNKPVTFYLFAFFFSVYLLTASGINVRMGDVAILRLEVVKSIIERSDISISFPEKIGIKGYDERNGIKGYDGREYSLFSIGSVVIALPFYVVSKLAGVPPENVISIINQLVGATTAVVVFLFSLALGYTRRASLYVSLCYGLGTFAWYYAKDPGDHAIETLFCLLSVYFMQRYSDHGKTAFLLFSSISIGSAFLTRPTSLMLIPPLMMLMVFQRKATLPIKAVIRAHLENMALYFASLLPFAGLFFWYNYSRFGSIFETGHTLMAARLGLDFFTGTPLLTGLIGFLASPGKGFFYYSPIAILFFFSLRTFRKKHPVTAILFVCIIISYLLFFSKNIYWHGDWAWGPRYLFVITPFVIIPLAELFDSIAWENTPLIRKGVYALFVLSLAIQLISVSVPIYNYFNYLQDNKVQFTVARGDGAPEIYEPRPETYFDLRYAPILFQAKQILFTGKNLSDYICNKDTQYAYEMKNRSSQPWINVFDFWWLYKYILENSLTGIMAAFVLLVISVISAMRLLKTIA
jgi:hypothetical protein